MVTYFITQQLTYALKKMKCSFENGDNDVQSESQIYRCVYRFTIYPMYLEVISIVKPQGLYVLLSDSFFTNQMAFSFNTNI